MKFAEYGKLVAEHYDLKYALVDGHELEYWLGYARAQAGPVLELGCGTGRVLVPLMEHGIDATGIDTSPDMLAKLHARCDERGLSPDVCVQPMQEFSLDRRFAMILVASCTLGLIVEEAEMDTMLDSVWHHLEPGGIFLPEIEAPPDPTSMARREGVWMGGWHTAPDGSAIASRQLIEYDPETHIRRGFLVMEKYVDQRLVATESNETDMRFYEPEEVVEKLRTRGFEDVVATNWLTDEPPDGSCRVISIKARKPA